MRDVLDGLLRDALPDGAELDVAYTLAAPSLTDADTPAVRLAREAIERATGMPCALVRTGGSIPVVAAMAARGWPVIVSGFGTAEDEIHAPNESYRLREPRARQPRGRRDCCARSPRCRGADAPPWPAPHG